MDHRMQIRLTEALLFDRWFGTLFLRATLAAYRHRWEDHVFYQQYKLSDATSRSVKG
jgi:hypothetical protein